MYSYLEGILAECTLTYAVIDCGGVGYLCSITESTYRAISGKPRAKLWTYLQVKEDAMTLFGFSDAGEKECFLQLISINGVGPKAAIAILSVLTPDSLASAVAAGDYRLITRANGVGTKLAQRICLELKDKLGKTAATAVTPAALAQNREVSEEAVLALVALGYNRRDAEGVVGKCTADNVNDMVRQALRQLM